MRTNIVFASLLVLAPWMFGQSPAPITDVEPADQEAFTLRQDVRNVVIDVVVTDKHGLPVKSLDKSRFEVFENGKPQSVAYFEEHSAASGPTNAAAPRPSDLPPDVHTNLTTAPGGGPLMILLFDALNTGIGDQSYVRAQVIDFLKQIPPGSTMAIFTLGDKLQMIQGFTGDPAVLRAALDGKSYPANPTISALGGGNGSRGGTGGGSGSVIPFSTSVSNLRSSLNQFSNGSTSLEQDLRIRYTLDAMNAISVYLAGIQGRKSLIWFAGSVPWVVNPDFSLVTDPTGRVDYSEELKKLADAMTVARISVYPIDASALVTPPGYGADRQGANFGVRGNGGAFGRQELNAQMNLAGNHMSMENLAGATGGRALYNTNGLGAAVGKVRTLGEDYYTIAYSPSDKSYDGTFRRLEVKVADPAVKLEYRRGYYADDPSNSSMRPLQTSANPLRAVMQRGAPDATQIPFTVQVKESAHQPDPSLPGDRVGNAAASIKGPAVRYEFHWSVDANRITFATSSGGLHTAEVQTTLDAYDANGTILNDIYAVLPLNLNDAQYARVLRGGLPMKQLLDIPAGLVYMRAGIVDASTGFTGATEFPLQVKVGQTAMTGSPAASRSHP